MSTRFPDTGLYEIKLLQRADRADCYMARAG